MNKVRQGQALIEILKSIFSDMPIIFAARDPHGAITLWSKGSELISGYTSAEMIGRSDGLELLFKNRDHIEKLRSEYTKRTAMSGQLMEIQCKNNSLKMISWYIASLQSDSNLDQIAIGVDVSAYKNAMKSMVELSQQTYKENVSLELLFDRLLQLDAAGGIDGERYGRRDSDRIGGMKSLGRRAIDKPIPDKTSTSGRRWYDAYITPEDSESILRFKADTDK